MQMYSVIVQKKFIKSIILVKKKDFDYIKAIIYLDDGTISWDPINADLCILEGVK